MGSEGVTLGLDGTIDVADFASAVDRFNRLLRAVTVESGADGRVGWVLSGLEFGSAMLSATPEPLDEGAAELVGAVVRRYGEVARQVRDSPEVDGQRPALECVRELAALTARSATEVRFETAESEVVFVTPARQGTRAEPARALGSVTGRVQTLQARGTLRFTLYDLVRDRAVSCFLRPGAEDTMRDAWGHVAEVTGMVSRDPVTDQPRSVRDVTSVRRIDASHAQGRFLAAEGAVTPAPDAPSSEAIIRDLRDAG